MDDFRVISIKISPTNQICINNPTNYPLIGQGAQGAVFKISDQRCVKIYFSDEYIEREYSSYQTAKSSPLIPKIYEKGPNYIVMEYLNIPSLEEYLQRKGKISEWLTKQIIYVLKEMKRLHFAKIDSFLRHIFVDKDHRLRIIDLVNAYSVKATIPSRLFGDLNRLGLLETFLKQVKEIEPKLYLEWKKSFPIV